MGLLAEMFLIGGVAMDLVGAVVLARVHNPETVYALREKVEGEDSALGEEDEISTHAQFLAEKRIGFFILTLGLTLYLIGLVLKTSEGKGLMAGVALGFLVLGFGATVLWVRSNKRHIKTQVHEAMRKKTARRCLSSNHHRSQSNGLPFRAWARASRFKCQPASTLVRYTLGKAQTLGAGLWIIPAAAPLARSRRASGAAGPSRARPRPAPARWP